MVVDKCKSCGASIVWIKTKKGRVMPCDPDPDMILVIEGKKITGIDKQGNTHVGYSGRLEGDDVEVYISHFSTCPFADQHRKRG